MIDSAIGFLPHDVFENIALFSPLDPGLKHKYPDKS